MDPREFGAAALAGAIRARDFTVADVVESHINLIEEVNPALNAVVTTMFDSARREAVEADELLESEGTDGLPPLFGVPVTVKDCWPVEGVRFTSGSWYHRDDVASRDALAVTRLRDAGAIILGKTNCPDMCWGFESVNPVFGRTTNARSAEHSAGGSSGGEASIVTAGGSALGLGSDIGGSLRNPAAMNGCVSLKPSAGRIPTDGHMPAAEGAIENWNVAGPIARRVEDLVLALSVLSGQDVPGLLEVAGVRCLVNLRSGPYFASREVRETVLLAAGALGSAGMVVERDDRLPIDRLGNLYTHMLRELAMPDIRRELGGGFDYSMPRELLRGVRGGEHISREALTVSAYIQWGGLLGRLTGDDSFQRLEKYKADLNDAIGNGVLLCPLLLTRPRRHGSTWMPLTQIPYATPFNATGMPAAIVPVRWTGSGLPLAVQVVAREGEDEMALAVAGELEKAFGGWKAP